SFVVLRPGATGVAVALPFCDSPRKWASLGPDRYWSN
ncbi:MAG: hypothetical protein ACI8S3_002619, partial [Alphaproteobacteria bacterium]